MRRFFFLSVLVTASLIGLGTTRALALEATFDVYYWSYAEEVPGNDDFVDEYSDPVFISLGLRRWNAGFTGVEPLFTTEIGGGPAHYAGSGKLDGYFYYKFRGEAYAAYRFGRFIPYIGLGYRALYDDSGGKTTTDGSLSYDRLSQYFYLPVGSFFQIADSLRIKGQFNWLLYGKQISYLSDISGFSDVENEQKSGWGVDTTLEFAVTKRIGLYGFFRYWMIDDSEDTVGFFNGTPAFTAVEPQNTTIETGIGISYKF